MVRLSVGNGCTGDRITKWNSTEIDSVETWMPIIAAHKPGDVVKEDDVLAVVMTDKAAVDVPSSVDGKVLELGGDIGEMMAVGATLIRIEVDGDGNESGVENFFGTDPSKATVGIVPGTLNGNTFTTTTYTPCK